MTLTTFPNIDQRSDAWYDQRRGLVTASVVGKLLTPTLKVADNDTSRGVVAALVSERITGVTEDTYVNDDMMRGILHEPLARARYAEVNAVTVTEVGFCVRREPTWTLGFSPDGFVGDEGLLEIKAPRAKTHLRTIIANEVPAHYVAQCQAGLLVTGRSWLDFVSFHAGLPLFTKRVLPEAKWQAALIAAAEQFDRDAERLSSEYFTACAGLPSTDPVQPLTDMEFTP